MPLATLGRRPGLRRLSTEAAARHAGGMAERGLLRIALAIASLLLGGSAALGPRPLLCYTTLSHGDYP